MNDNKNSDDDYFDTEAIIRYMSLSVEEKLIYLEEINSFLTEAMPEKSKRAWKELKKNGW